MTGFQFCSIKWQHLQACSNQRKQRHQALHALARLLSNTAGCLMFSRYEIIVWSFAAVALLVQWQQQH
jgi:hypothetical protein